MRRYLVERTFPNGLRFPTDGDGRRAAASLIDTNGAEGVTWVHSYVSEDDRTTFCVYDAPDPEAIRRVARANKLPLDRITEVRVLDPYFYAADSPAAVDIEVLADLEASLDAVVGGLGCRAGGLTSGT
jgi:hypothetical protein